MKRCQTCCELFSDADTVCPKDGKELVPFISPLESSVPNSSVQLGSGATETPSQQSPMQILFLLHGRIGRRTFLGAYIGLVFANLVLLTLTFAVAGSWSEGKGLALHSLLHSPLIYAMFAIQIKRLHDFDASGWFAVIFIVPLLNPLFLLRLLCVKGTIGNNSYGPAPTTRAKQFPCPKCGQQVNFLSWFARPATQQVNFSWVDGVVIKCSRCGKTVPVP